MIGSQLSTGLRDTNILFLPLDHDPGNLGSVLWCVASQSGVLRLIIWWEREEPTLEPPDSVLQQICSITPLLTTHQGIAICVYSEAVQAKIIFE